MNEARSAEPRIRGLRWKSAAGGLALGLALSLSACAGPEPEGPELSPARALPPAAGQPAERALPRVPPERNPFGINAHVIPYDAMQWDRIAWLGVGWVRIDLPWWGIHRGPDQFEWSRIDGTVAGAMERGLEVLAILHSTPPWVLGIDEV